MHPRNKYKVRLVESYIEKKYLKIYAKNSKFN